MSLDPIADEIKIDIIPKDYEALNAAKRKALARTFTTDTVTAPSKDMYEYALNASLGDDVYSEPTTLALEAHMAKITGKEAALFVPTGTMSNQLALRSHLMQPPYTVLCDERSHINKYEVGGAAFHSGASLTTVIATNGHHLSLEDVQDNIIYETDLHVAPTEVVALENTLNGTIFPQDEIVAISEFVHSKGLKMHLDGARIWHVAAETLTSVKKLCEPFDSVSMCFSKGLGAPIGSCLVGSKDFIYKARRFRKLFGAGMRQTGVIAACAAYALTYNFSLLPKVHKLTKKLEAGLKELGVDILSGGETCMVFYNPAPLGLDFNLIAKRAAELPEPIFLGGSRLVVHIQTSEQAVDDFLGLLRALAKERTDAGFVYVKHKIVAANGKLTNVYIRH